MTMTNEEMRDELHEIIASHRKPAPSAGDLARARAVIIGAEYDAHKMQTGFERKDNRSTEVRDEDRARLRVVAAESTGHLGSLARELNAVHSAAVDTTDNLARLAFFVAFLARRAGIDLDAAIDEYEHAAELVANWGEGDDYVPASRADQ